SIRVQGWFDPQKMDDMKLSQVVFADGGSWSREWLSQSAGASASQALVNAMAAFNPPAAGQMTAQPDSQSAPAALAASSWH
ncbi:calcium-binding protein, partial [Chromobacterium piscinae]